MIIYIIACAIVWIAIMIFGVAFFRGAKGHKTSWRMPKSAFTIRGEDPCGANITDKDSK